MQNSLLPAFAGLQGDAAVQKQAEFRTDLCPKVQIYYNLLCAGFRRVLCGRDDVRGVRLSSTPAAGLAHALAHHLYFALEDALHQCRHLGAPSNRMWAHIWFWTANLGAPSTQALRATKSQAGLEGSERPCPMDGALKAPTGTQERIPRRRLRKLKLRSSLRSFPRCMRSFHPDPGAHRLRCRGEPRLRVVGGAAGGRDGLVISPLPPKCLSNSSSSVASSPKLSLFPPSTSISVSSVSCTKLSPPLPYSSPLQSGQRGSQTKARLSSKFSAASARGQDPAPARISLQIGCIIASCRP